MTLPKTILDFLNSNAKRIGVQALGEDDNLFTLGVIDSFALINLISILEQEYGIKIPDDDVEPINFQTINAIKRYITQKG